ncbi:MAG: Lrp/AsnC family transcriptional regulator [Sphingomonadaceae bacterium]
MLALPVDGMDRKIMRTLQDNPEFSIAELSAAIGLSQTPCWRRLKRLEKDGFIVGRAIILSESKLGLSVSVFAHLRLQKHDEQTLEALERDVCNHPEIVECFSMSGESDYVVRVVIASIEEYEQFLKKVLLHLPGVGSINSSFTLKKIKATTKLPI